jgi:uncharacterized protein (TIGR03067 family)
MLFLLVFLGYLTPPPADLVAAERKELKGTWVIHGGNLPDDVRRQARVIIDDGLFTLEVGEQRTTMVIDLDPTQSPRQINLTKGQRVARGIYELKNDTLTICYEVQGGVARPQKLAIVSGSEVLLILKRAPRPE